MIFVNEPYIGPEELEYVQDCVRSGWISSKGSYVDQFEEGFSRFCGTKYGVSTTSGTTAIHLALASLGIGKGDEVILPAFTMIATAYPILYVGATPVLVDCEPDTYNIDISQIEEKIRERTKALLIVHIYGHPVYMQPLWDLAAKYDLCVIEDAAEAHGAEYNGRRTGGLGDIGCFSFYANKIITTGEGGMIVTDDEQVYRMAQTLKDLAHSKEQRFLHEYLAFNYRLTNLQAALGVAQLEKAARFIEIKRKNAALYTELLREVGHLRLPVEKPYAKNVYWMYTVVVEEEFGLSRDTLQQRLKDHGIETRPFFTPMHQQPVFQKMGLFEGETYPVAEDISKRGFYLPSGLTLTEDQIEYICDTIDKVRQL